MPNSQHLSKKQLIKWYVQEGKSMRAIADMLGCSVHKVEGGLKKYDIKRRSISDAIYLKHNPDGDPFQFDPPRTNAEWRLFGMGIGLYWGEGTKANKHAVRLGNTDPALLGVFLDFLIRFYRIRQVDCRFGLQIFTDMDPSKALDFWSKKLKIHKRQFYKPTITISGSIGTYRQKSRYGVLTIYYSNCRLRDALINSLHSYGYETS
jgi:hypothetical protein